jgi:putative hemolysin
MRQHTKILVMILSIALILLSGCNYQKQKYMLDNEELSKEKAKTETQTANPATLHCMNTTGAAWTVRENDDGQYGVCTFSDGSWCEEWAYYRGECLPGNNMTLCEGKFWGKSVCPSLYEPVCATLLDTDPITNQTYDAGKETFPNACIACINVDLSNPDLKTKGYVAGRCD